MVDELFRLPERPFYSCDEDGFAVIDGALMRTGLGSGSVRPALKLEVGPGNVFEQRPRRVVGQDGDVVRVECDGGVTVHLDFGRLAARVQRPEGEFLYRGGLDEGNEGRGFLAAR